MVSATLRVISSLPRGSASALRRRPRARTAPPSAAAGGAPRAAPAAPAAAARTSTGTGTSTDADAVAVADADADADAAGAGGLSTRGPVTDASVPEGHRGLHDFLYGGEGQGQGQGQGQTARGAADGAADGGGRGAHGLSGAHADAARARALAAAAREDDGGRTVRVGEWLAARAATGASLAGVFALADAGGATQLISYSRDVVASVRALQRRHGAQRVALVRCALVAGRMARREELRALADSWLQRELPHVPPGNAPGAEGAPGSEWGAHDSAAELQGGARAAYEEQRLKMRKAMGENLHDVPRDESDGERERREKLLRAVEGDNWSAVVGQQTVQASSRDEADDGADDGATQRLQRQAMVSPFAREGVQQTAAGASIDVATGAVAAPVLTVAAAHECLDEMRPYLIADGGDVEVVGVEDGVVALRLTGACGTCPSSATTMSMGLEKALRKTFGEQIAQVAQVDAAGAPTGPGGGGPPTVTRASVEEHLATLRPTLKKYGGRVKVARVEGDRVEVEFEGAEPLFMGIEAALKNKFPTLAEVARVPEE